MNTDALLAAVVALPLVGALLVAACGERRPNLREAVTVVTASLVLALVLRLLWAESETTAALSAPLVLAEPWPGVTIALAVEPLGLLFALVASFLWLVTSLYAIGYMRGHGETNQTRFYAFFAVAISAAMGIAFAANLFTLFLFYEALSIGTFPLVTHAGTAEARRAGRAYLGILLGTSIGFFLLALVWTWAIAGTLDFTAGGVLAGRASPFAASALLVLFLFGIGKAGLMPFHRWLPAAMVAPTPVSALLHAKAGVFTVLKICVYIFGADFLSQVPAREVMMYVAAATVLLASLVALRKDNLKVRLAYSTVSQLSYVVLGALLANSPGFIGGGMHILMHAFGKITLFFCAGAILVATHKTEVSDMRGLGRAMPVTMGAFFIASLSIIGLPPGGGLWSKWLLALASVEAGEFVLLATLLLSSLLNIAYLLPVPLRAFFGKGEGRDVGLREAPGFCLAAIAVTTAGCVALFIWPDAAQRLLSAMGGVQ
ncbi:MAG: proton-conducting transporter membrane subunit [Gammaproteobacteria bacterium]|nr:proton-conducting transporter membrane subunit [Gammaproteobacteria bacterium]